MGEYISQNTLDMSINGQGVCTSYASDVGILTLPFLSEIKELPKAKGVEKIYMPGEPEFEKRAWRLEHGYEVSDVVYEDLVRLCDQYNVACDVRKKD